MSASAPEYTSLEQRYARTHPHSALRRVMGRVADSLVASYGMSDRLVMFRHEDSREDQQANAKLDRAQAKVESGTSQASRLARVHEALRALEGPEDPRRRGGHPRKRDGLLRETRSSIDLEAVGARGSRNPLRAVEELPSHATWLQPKGVVLSGVSLERTTWVGKDGRVSDGVKATFRSHRDPYSYDSATYEDSITFTQDQHGRVTPEMSSTRLQGSHRYKSEHVPTPDQVDSAIVLMEQLTSLQEQAASRAA